MPRDFAGREKKGKRRLGVGRLRPNDVHYGEENPRGEMIGEMTKKDMGMGPEVVFVVGAALNVPGSSMLVTELCRAVKGEGGFTVWINRDAPLSGLKVPLDLAFGGDCDEVASLLSC